jgi:hypothetical protein
MSESPDFREFKLEAVEKNLERWTFLMSIGSAFFTCFIAFCLVVLFYRPRDPLPTGSLLDSDLVTLEFAEGAIILFFFVLWLWPLARMWRPLIFIGTTTVAFLGCDIVAKHVLESYQPGIELTNSHVLLFYTFSLIAGAFWFQILWAGWRLTFAPRRVRNLLITAQSGLLAFRKSFQVPLEFIHVASGFHKTRVVSSPKVFLFSPLPYSVLL